MLHIVLNTCADTFYVFVCEGCSSIWYHFVLCHVYIVCCFVDSCMYWSDVAFPFSTLCGLHTIWNHIFAWFYSLIVYLILIDSAKICVKIRVTSHLQTHTPVRCDLLFRLYCDPFGRISPQTDYNWTHFPQASHTSRDSAVGSGMVVWECGSTIGGSLEQSLDHRK